MLAYEDVGAASDWLVSAFGFAELVRYAEDDGRVTHVTLERDGAVVMLGWPGPEYRGPRRHAEDCEVSRRWLEAPWVVDGVLVSVEGVDEHHRRAAAAGARVLSPPETNEAVGQRQYRVEDVEGHRWMFVEPLAEAV